MKVVVIAELPDNKVLDLCELVSNFDTRTPGCKFTFLAVAPDKSVEEISKLLKIQPPSRLKVTIKNPEKSAN